VVVVHDPVDLVRAHLAEWDSAFVELDTFGTDDAARIVAIVDAFCRERLGSPLAGYLFYGSSIGSTHGVRLADGRDVVIKARQPAETNPDMRHDRATLDTICRVMAWLRAGGYPCARVILGPTPIGSGLATVEELFVRGEHGDGFQPRCRRVIASGFADLIERLRSCEVDASGLRQFERGPRLFPQPHGKIFDFEATAAGAGWIDDFARRARKMEAHDGARVLGHSDWRVEHLRFDGDRIVATYDWDSLAFRAETDLVGSSAHGFTADWSRPDARRIPTADDIRAYVSDYESARGRSFSKPERRHVFATCVYSIAYGARCQHSLAPATREWTPDTFPYLLRTAGDALLAEAAG